MSALWVVRQVQDVVHRFRDKQCDRFAWNEIRVSIAILIEKGPHAAGPRVAKKLSGADGIWELKARCGNLQPRLLFYVEPVGATAVFVHAFMKKGTHDYDPAIKLAKKRRKDVEQGRVALGTVLH
jgi:phage-related protein